MRWMCMEQNQKHEERVVNGTSRESVLTRYDLVLAVVPLAFVGALVAGLFSSVSVYGALAVGALIGTVSVLDALFVNPPEHDNQRDGRRRRAD